METKKELKAALKFITCAISKDDTRPHIKSVFVDVLGDTFKLVSIDGHRMHTVEAKLNGRGLTADKATRLDCRKLNYLIDLLDNKTGAELADLVPDCLIAVDDQTFPPYREMEDLANQCVNSGTRSMFYVNPPYLLDAAPKIANQIEFYPPIEPLEMFVVKSMIGDLRLTACVMPMRNIN